jgi:hypothetical protein
MLPGTWTAHDANIMRGESRRTLPALSQLSVRWQRLSSIRFGKKAQKLEYAVKGISRKWQTAAGAAMSADYTRFCAPVVRIAAAKFGVPAMTAHPITVSPSRVHVPGRWALIGAL